LVVIVWADPVALSVKVTVAPATTAPVESVTNPFTVPAVCEYKPDGARTSRQQNAQKNTTTRLLNMRLPPIGAEAAPRNFAHFENRQRENSGDDKIGF
jgi:hypothetical protein